MNARVRLRRFALAVIVSVGVAVVPAVARASSISDRSICSTGCERLKFAAGPYVVKPGANLILTQLNEIPKPAVDGFMVRVAPNLHYALPNGKCCGAIPRVDVIHLHHGVWLSDGVAGEGEGNTTTGFYPFMGSGEEKTIYQLPQGYGYPIRASDQWILNYMIHNLWPNAAKIYITYDMDFIPATSPAARGITPVHPIWMDVEDHHLYSVFDVKRYSGTNGRYTFPDQAHDPYRAFASPLNEFTVDHPGTLIATAGHVHPGGLYTTLDLVRPGTRIGRSAIRGSVQSSVRLFRSYAHYWDKRGPISWDMAMTGTAQDWRPRVSAGDTMRVSATYDTRRASWYESMGIMVVWEAYDSERGLNPFDGQVHPPIARAAGVDPFGAPINQKGYLTHGHLSENNHHGGTPWLTVNAATLPSCRTAQVNISGFVYNPGDLQSPHTCAPTIRRGRSLTFVNRDAVVPPPGTSVLSAISSQNSVSTLLNPGQAYIDSIFHTITACQNPCGFDTGISYPLANGAGIYDSGQLGYGSPAADRVSWSTPSNLRPGTYTFFCRIHPFMRGVFRVIS